MSEARRVQTIQLTLSETRKRAKKTQPEIAVLLGLKSVQTVRNWERGETEPHLTPEQTVTYCEALGCTLPELRRMVAAARAEYLSRAKN